MVWSFLILNKDKKSKVVLFYSLISPLKKKGGAGPAIASPWSGSSLGRWHAHPLLGALNQLEMP